MNDDTIIERTYPVLDTLLQECAPQADAPCLRLVTAACVFESDDAALHIMHRLIRAHRVEVIHLGRHRSARDVARAAVQEDADAVMVSCQDSGNAGYFRDLLAMLREHADGPVPVFVITVNRLNAGALAELAAIGVAQVYRGNDMSDADLAHMLGTVKTCAQVAQPTGHAHDQNIPSVARLIAPSAAQSHMVLSAQEAGYAWWPMPQARPAPTLPPLPVRAKAGGGHSLDSTSDLTSNSTFLQKERAIARMLSAVEDTFNATSPFRQLRKCRHLAPGTVPVIGITGPGGAGKSTVTDALITRFLAHFPEMRIAVISLDSTRRQHGGALLGDRLHMNALHSQQVYMRSMASRRQALATSVILQEWIESLRSEDFDLVMVETAGIGQSDTMIVDLVDVPVYVMTPDYGAASQLEKIDMLDDAELVVFNKYDQPGAWDALMEVSQQWRKNHSADPRHGDNIPVYPTIANQRNDPGVERMFFNLCQIVRARMCACFPQTPADVGLPTGVEITSGCYCLNLMPTRCDFDPLSKQVA